jgi:hypothetical protein
MAANSQNLLIDEAYEAQNPFPRGEKGDLTRGAGVENPGP